MRNLFLKLFSLENFYHWHSDLWRTQTFLESEKQKHNKLKQHLWSDFLFHLNARPKNQIFKRNPLRLRKCNITYYIFYIAEQMCRFTRAEFLQGCRALKADNIKSVQQRLPEAAAEALARSDLFKDLYRYTFRFGLASTSCATRYSEREYLEYQQNNLSLQFWPAYNLLIWLHVTSADFWLM